VPNLCPRFRKLEKNLKREVWIKPPDPPMKHMSLYSCPNFEGLEEAQVLNNDD
jgi:hypothetical protein